MNGRTDTFAEAFDVDGDAPTVNAGCWIDASAMVCVAAQVVDIVIEEPTSGIVVRRVFQPFGTQGSGTEWITTGPGSVPASLFSSAICRECRKAAVGAFIGKSWPRLAPGERMVIRLENTGCEIRTVRASLICKDVET